MNELTIREPGSGALTERQPSTLLEAVFAQIKNKDLTPAQIKEYLDIGERLEARAAKQQFAAAMDAMATELPTISKHGVISYGVGKGSTSFARWEDIHRACMPILHDHGFSVSFTSDLIPPNALRVTVRVKHVGGHEEDGSITVPWLDQGGSKSPAQAAASSETLAMRHAFCKFFNILTTDQDDDGSGKGIPEHLTQQQIDDLDTMLVEIENRDKGGRARFMNWLQKTYRVGELGELFQGEPLDAVRALLTKKLNQGAK